MPGLRPTTWLGVIAFLSALLILKIVGGVWLSYAAYFPPDFNAAFLRGRETHFFGTYLWAFYPHILSGPIALLLGLVLLSRRFRQKYLCWHRRLGRLQAVNVLLLVAPSGLWMARQAEAGPIAALGFATLAIATGLCVALGWRAAVRRRFLAHQRWMQRCYVLLCSAVVIRLVGGLATVTGLHFTWLDPLMAWASWLAPLAVYELTRLAAGATAGSPAVR